MFEGLLAAGNEAWSLDVTVSSPYDSTERHADGWRVLAYDGTVLGEHVTTIAYSLLNNWKDTK